VYREDATQAIEYNPSLQAIKDLLAARPDAKRLDSLRTPRGKGRNDYPLRDIHPVNAVFTAVRKRGTMFGPPFCSQESQVFPRPQE